MRVALVVTGGVDRSGRERVIPALLWLVERLARRHEVHVYVLRHDDTPCTYPLLGATVHDLGRPEGPRRQYAALVGAWRTLRPDVVHAYWAVPSGVAAAGAARRLGLPSIVTLDSGEFVALPDIGYGLQRSWRGRAAVAAVLRLATRLTVCTRAMERLAQAHGARPVRIPIGIDVHRFSPAPRPEGPPWRLVHVASLNAVKDHGTLLAAFRQVAGRVPGCHLDIVGEDTLRGRVHELARVHGVDAQVSFSGFLPTDQVVPRYQAAHLHVVSSRHEAAGVVVLEAAACGVPTVGTAVGYVADWSPERAMSVPAGDAGALADAIVLMIGDPVRRRATAAAARDWTLAHDAGFTADAFERLYQAVI